MSDFDVIVLGAGAAGLFCASQAGQRGRRVLLLEKMPSPGRKILISGGGRCNFTNSNASPKNFLSANPHFAKSALARYTPKDFIALVERYAIKYHEKTLGQLFCDGSAHQIVDMLRAECTRGGVDLRLGQDIAGVNHADNIFTVTTQDGSFTATSLVIATGGPSIPKMGASFYAYDLARQFGLKVVEPRPALVPLTLGGDDVLFRDLSGVSAPTEAHCGKVKFREATLFTHRGLSGPAVLQISSYWYPGQPVSFNLLPDRKSGWLIEAKQANPSSTVLAALRGDLPDRLADILAKRLDCWGDLGNIPDKKLREAEAKLAKWEFHPNGSEGFAKAEVTIGGISTEDLSSKTMEARNVPGLYAIGEAVDVTGWLGGYNFQWAWASAYAAAQAV